jgi:hypothetical protein
MARRNPCREPDDWNDTASLRALPSSHARILTPLKLQVREVILTPDELSRLGDPLLKGLGHT